MKKRIVAMAIVAAMVTGCASGTGADEVNEQSSAAVQSTEAVLLTLLLRRFILPVM